ncbi:hypothetical protein E2C01_077655 [Portunus trituberculatus]|uniref:Uncharacterized protein n=1 Tax=Portunus trituberculatus TaxID=210409 RepID=A0A5B7IMW3_PORTR|nr:hypothetical protein [Portunus trituberculatus]
MTQVVSSSAVKQQISMMLLMAPSQPSHFLEKQMMSFPRLRDSRDFSPHSSSAEWADKDKTLLSALLEANIEGPAVAGSVSFTGLNK